MYYGVVSGRVLAKRLSDLDRVERWLNCRTFRSHFKGDERFEGGMAPQLTLIPIRLPLRARRWRDGPGSVHRGEHPGSSFVLCFKIRRMLVRR